MGLSEEKAYEILGLPQNSSAYDVLKSYKRLSLYWFPDKTGTGLDNVALEKFRSVTLAIMKVFFPKEDINFSLSADDMLAVFQQIFFGGDNSCCMSLNDDSDEVTQKENSADLYKSDVEHEETKQAESQVSDVAQDATYDEHQIIKKQKKAEKRKAEKKRKRERKKLEKASGNQKDEVDKLTVSSKDSTETTEVNNNRGGAPILVADEVSSGTESNHNAPRVSYYYLVDGPYPLPDSNLRASTSKDPSSGPQSARLSSVQSLKSSGAWIAGTLDSSQYLEIDLGKIQPVYGTATKGRDGADEWVKSYYVLFSRDGTSFSYVCDETDFQKNKVFSGNFNSSTKVEHILITPFEARYVRIQPITYMKKIALRADLLGGAKDDLDDSNEILSNDDDDWYEHESDYDYVDVDDDYSYLDVDDDYVYYEDCCDRSYFLSLFQNLGTTSSKEADKNALALITEEERAEKRAKKCKAQKKKRKESKVEKALSVEEQKQEQNDKETVRRIESAPTSDQGSCSSSDEDIDLSSAFVTAIAKKKKTQINVKVLPQRSSQEKKHDIQMKITKKSSTPSDRTMQLAAHGYEMAQAGNFAAAINLFTEAITLDSSDHRYYGNRSFCYERLGRYRSALEDAELAISISPKWAKGHFRKGKALVGLKEYIEAENCFIEVLLLDPECNDASTEIFNAKVLQIMEKGLSKEQAEAMVEKSYHLDSAVDVLSRGDSSDVVMSQEADIFISDCESDSGWLVAGCSSKQRTERGEKSNPLELPKSELTLWIGNIPEETSEGSLYSVFSRYGKIRHLVKLPQKIPKKICVLVTYKDKTVARKAMEAMQGLKLNGVKLAIKYARRSR